MIFAAAFVASAESTPKASASTDSAMVQKTETTKKTPESKTTTKGMTVVGSVKTFDAGKEIVVTGPKKKSYSFDLDDKNMMSKVDPAVTVGTKVKVVEHTDSAGMKTLTVAPYASAHHKKSSKKTAASSSSGS